MAERMTIAETMTIVETRAKGPGIGTTPRGTEPPLAPLAMPKQVLTRDAGPRWRGFGALVALLGRDLGRAG